ncbi:MAG: S8 family serine peptidase [Coleofasciculaceae cyanobacterium RL_1_1]|nr:S8 family serine peptidase [Coleofasciculaceae cyanobacterium RL_1_1]
MTPFPASDSTDPSNPNQNSARSSAIIDLHRGGEVLPLVKHADRFSLRLDQAADEAMTIAAIVDSSTAASLATYCGEVAIGSDQSLKLLEFAATQDLDQAMAAARGLPGVAFVSHVYTIAESAGSLVYLADELSILFQPNLDPDRRQALATAFAIEFVTPIIGLPDAFVYRLTSEAKANPIKLANAIATLPEVVNVEANVVIRSTPNYRPSDSLYSRQWYLQNSGGSQLAEGSHINIETAWNVTRGDRSIVVAIADDSIDLDHPDFQGMGKIVAPQDLAGRDFLPLPEAESDNHGTACAGVCLAEETGDGVVGVAPGCAMMPIRTTGYLDDVSIEDLFNWAITQGAAVISCSWGASAVSFPLSMRQQAAIGRAARQGRNGKGCVVVFAAGNANRPTQGTIDEQGWTKGTLSGPTQWLAGYATHPDAIVVSASTSLNRKAAYSNWGKHISVCAPSNNAPPGMWFPQDGYLYTAPKIQASLPGLGVFTTDRLGAAGYSPSAFTETFGGTSSACPVVAGVAALVLSVNPNLTAAQVKQILQDSADKIEDPNPDPQLGLRYGTYDKNGHSLWFGYGKVNAGEAVRMAKQMLQSVPQSTGKRIRGTNDRPMTIPDDKPGGVSSPIRVLETRPILDMEITIELEHGFPHDLELFLIAPDRTTIQLQGRTLGSTTQIKCIYTEATTPALLQFHGRSGEGIWTLRVVDRAIGDVGTLKRWQFELGF